MTKEIDIQQLATWPESQTFDRKSIRITSWYYLAKELVIAKVLKYERILRLKG